MTDDKRSKKMNYEECLHRMTQVAAEYDTYMASVAILKIFETRLDILADEIRDASKMPRGLGQDDNLTVESVAGRIWDEAQTWKAVAEEL
jgi:hypothetical protein